MRLFTRLLFLIPSIAMIVWAVPAHAASAPKVTEYFSTEIIHRAARYRGPAYALTFAALIANLAVLVFLASPLAASMRARIAGGRWWTGALAIAAVITLVPTIVTFPLEVARRTHDRSFGLVTNSFGGFLGDQIKGLAFSVVLAAIVALAFTGVARVLPRAWPFAAAGAAAVLTFALVFLLPVVYEPLFNKFASVDPVTKQRILALADQAGVRVRDVLVADASRRTTRENAYVSGIGGTKRVVLYDTLLRNESPDEVDLVVAHELSHDRHHDVLNGTLLGIAGAWLGVAVLWLLFRSDGVLGWARISGPGDPKALAFVALFVAVATIVTLPAQNAVSRRVEARADRSAIELTDDPHAAVSLEQNLAIRNLADLQPNAFVRWMFFTHPSVMERIQIALEYEAR